MTFTFTPRTAAVVTLAIVVAGALLAEGGMAVTLPQPEYLMAYYNFSEGTGTTTASSGLFNEVANLGNGTAGYTPTWTTGKVDNAVLFNRDSFVNLTNSSNCAGNNCISAVNWSTTNFTVAGWLNERNNSLQTVGLAYARLPTGSWEIVRGSGGKIVATIYCENGTSFSVVTSQIIQNNTWYHFAAEFNNTGVKVYINGKPDSAKMLNCRPADASLDYIYLGIDSRTLTERNLNGTLDEVGIWNTTLSDGEVSDLYHSQVGCIVPYSGITLTDNTTLCTDNYRLNGTTSATGAIIMGAHNLNLNCNNSIIIGNSSTGFYGVSSSSKNNLTITNCSFVGYDYGINIVGGNATIYNNTINDSITYAIRFRNSVRDNRVFNNTIRYTTQPTNTGSDIILSNADWSVIENNTIYDGHYRGIYMDDNSGDGASYNTIRFNYINNSYQNGIEAYRSSNTTWIYNNTILWAKHNGINVRTSNNTVTNNTIDYAYHHGIDLYACVSSDFFADNNTVTYNTITHMLETHFIFVCNSSANTIKNNYMSMQNGTEGYGVNFDQKSKDNLFVSNTINGTTLEYLFFSIANNITIENNTFANSGTGWWANFSSLSNVSANFTNNNNGINFVIDQFHGAYRYLSNTHTFKNNNATNSYIINMSNLLAVSPYSDVRWGNGTIIARGQDSVSVSIPAGEYVEVGDYTCGTGLVYNESSKSCDQDKPSSGGPGGGSPTSIITGNTTIFNPTALRPASQAPLTNTQAFVLIAAFIAIVYMLKSKPKPRW